MAAIDIAGFVADLKDHAVDHGFHVHDERHFVETYSLRQAWEVDLHPEEACGGPLDLHLSLEVDPRTLLSFEDLVAALSEEEDPPDSFYFPMLFTWSLPPLPAGPDLLLLATELAGVGQADLPLEVSAIDSYPSATDPSERSLTIVAHLEVSLARVFGGQEQLCDILDRCAAVSHHLLDRAPAWLGDTPERPLRHVHRPAALAPGSTLIEEALHLGDLRLLGGLDGFSEGQEPEADALFLDLMAEHHRGGAHMAAYAADNASDADVRGLAEVMERNQSIEIAEFIQTAERFEFDIDIEPYAPAASDAIDGS